MQNPLAWSVVPMFLVACGGTPEHAEAPVEASSVAATPTAAASAVVSAAPSASAAASSDKPPANDKGPFHFTDYAGPKVKASIDTPRAWNVQPVGRKSEWDILKIAREEFGRVEGDEVVIKHFDGAEIFVPGALVFPSKPAKGLKKGDVVLADVAAASAPARISALDGEGEETRVTVKYMWGGSESEDTLDLTQVLPLSDKVGYGARVAWKADDKWRFGDYAGGDATKAFVIEEGGRGSVVEQRQLRALKLGPVYKPGTKVWVGTWTGLQPGKVTKVVGDGIGYIAKLDSGDTTEPTSFDQVTSPLE
jgi:hypothetical protein